MAAGVLSMSQLFLFSTMSNTTARADTFSAVLAEQKLEQLRSLAWGFDVAGLPVSDFATDVTVTPESPTGGRGLQPSPASALQQNTTGYVDHVDASGNIVGNGVNPPNTAVYTRRWSVEPLPTNPNNTLIIQVLVTPNQVQFLAGVADNFIRKVLIDQEHSTLIPQWYGETVGFWDDETLVAWTANVQGWTTSHSMFEFSNSLEVIEIIREADDGEGLVVEAIFYDPEAFVKPLRIVTPWNRTGGIDDPEQRYLFVECRVENGIVLGPDGRPSQLTPFDEGYIDFLGRPWAQNWEKFFEQGWERPPPAE